jgi:hypothetical protein
VLSRALALAALALMALAGCGSDTDPETPVACLVGPKAYLAALDDAPSHMQLKGEVPISECLVQNQEAGDLARVGSSALAAATALNAEARQHPGGTANFELGYLVGELNEGSEDTQGIHAELVRRVEAAARYSPQGEQLPATFLSTYEEGYEEGITP